MDNITTKEVSSLKGILIILVIAIIIASLSIWLYHKTHNELINNNGSSEKINGNA